MTHVLLTKLALGLSALLLCMLITIKSLM